MNANQRRNAAPVAMCLYILFIIFKSIIIIIIHLLIRNDFFEVNAYLIQKKVSTKCTGNVSSRKCIVTCINDYCTQHRTYYKRGCILFHNKFNIQLKSLNFQKGF